MGKNKKNPNRVPLGDVKLDIKALTDEASSGMMYYVWAELLGALADDPSITADDMLRFWEYVNLESKKIKGVFTVDKWAKKVRELTGMALPFANLSISGIRTEGDLKRFKAKAKQNAICATYAVVASAVLKEDLAETEQVATMFRKALALEEEIREGRISTADLVEMVREEYGLLLQNTEHGTNLERVQKKFSIAGIFPL